MKRVLNGFQSDIPRFEHFANRFRVSFCRGNASPEESLQAIVDVLEVMLDGSITRYLKLFWSPTGQQFEKTTLRALVHSCNAFSTSNHHALYQELRESLSIVLEVMQASVSLVFERAMYRSSNRSWGFTWGGFKRLEEGVTFVEFVRTEIKSQLASMMLSFAITVASAFCIGSVNTMRERADLIGAPDEEMMNHRYARTKMYTVALPKLMTFARGCLRERVIKNGQVERFPMWKSMGVWIFLFISQMGTTLRDCRVNHCVLSRDLDKVLQKGKQFYVGTYGRYMNMPAELESKSVQSSWDHVCFIRYLEYAIFCVIDSADVQGRDAILHTICKMDSVA